MPLNGEAGGEEDAHSQGHVADTLRDGVELVGIDVVDLEGEGADEEAEENKDKVCQAEEG